MEAVIRKPFQGIYNIIRFNWHFYVAAAFSVTILMLAGKLIGGLAFWACVLLAFGIVVSTSVSLLVSFYVYDQSGLYNFLWLQKFNKQDIRNVVNIHAGFDETSAILKEKLPGTTLQVFDFYDAAKHTEVSIERARKAYPSYDGTFKIATSELPLANNSADLIFNVFALHEIRNSDERIQFLKEQVRALNSHGKIVLVEHLRDVPNFAAYNVGFFHFLPGSEWRQNFQRVGLSIEDTFKITPFVSVFILRKADGNTP